MSRHHLLAWMAAALIVPAALAGAGTAALALGAPATAAKAHHQRGHKKAKPKHHKAKHHKTTSPKSSKSPKSDKLEECSTTIYGSGPMPETNTYGYQVLLVCGKGEFGSFSVSTNRAITAGSITAQIGTEYKYTCQPTASTSFSCSGVKVTIPPDEEGAIRAFFKSTQPVCEGSASETATVTTEGETFDAKIGEAQSPC